MDLKSVRISLNIMDFGKYVENCRLREMLLSVLFALAGVPVGMAQMQVVAKLEGVKLPVVDCRDTYLYVLKDGDREQTDYGDYTIRTASAFGGGFVEISERDPIG